MIRQQIELAFAMLVMGILLAAGYDILLIGREIVRRSRIFIAFEDIIYWLIGAVCTFSVIYNINEGVIRGYAIVALVGMAILFQWVVGRKVVMVSASFAAYCRKSLINLFYRCKIKKGIGKNKRY